MLILGDVLDKISAYPGFRGKWAQILKEEWEGSLEIDVTDSIPVEWKQFVSKTAFKYERIERVLGNNEFADYIGCHKSLF